MRIWNEITAVPSWVESVCVYQSRVENVARGARYVPVVSRPRSLLYLPRACRRRQQSRERSGHSDGQKSSGWMDTLLAMLQSARSDPGRPRRTLVALVDMRDGTIAQTHALEMLPRGAGLANVTVSIFAGAGEDRARTGKVQHGEGRDEKRQGVMQTCTYHWIIRSLGSGLLHLQTMAALLPGSALDTRPWCVGWRAARMTSRCRFSLSWRLLERPTEV